MESIFSNQPSYLKMCARQITAKVERKFPPSMVKSLIEKKGKKKEKQKVKKKEKKKEKQNVG